MNPFKTERRESWPQRIRRWGFNFFPAYRASGAWIIFLSDDWKEVHVKLRLKWSTRNYVGTVFGGSLYSALNPVYMVQLINILGDEYKVWDKAATVRYHKPVTEKVYARFLITDKQLKTITAELANKNSTIQRFAVSFIDENGTVYTSLEQQIYIARR